jgi:hypothetical protein
MSAGAPSRDGAGSLARQAWEVWTRAQDALRAGDFAGYGAELKRIEKTLRAIIAGPR